MDLKPLSLDDLALFQKLIRLSDYEGYNSNFVTMYMWNHEYNVHYYANEHYLVALCHYEHLLFWIMPLTTQTYFYEAWEFMETYSEEHHLPFYVDGVLNEQCDWVAERYPGKYQIVKQRGEYDYIYDRGMLETLSGKKMQKRRNHYNTFIKLYGDHYRYRELTVADQKEVNELLRKWSSLKPDDPNIEIERYGIMALLEAQDTLPIKTGCIEIDGKIEAFIIGSMLNHQTLQIHVEKANTEYRGLYVAILKNFLENEFKEAIWVNREDDLDIATMRQAKMNLHPVKLLEKAFIYPNKGMIRRSEPKDFAQLVRAWKVNFGDSDAYIKDYFETYYRPENTWVYEIDKMIISIVHLRPVSIVCDGKIDTARYIEGVSTHFMFRHQGYMKALMETALAQSPCDYFLLQAYDWQVYQFLHFEDYTYKHQYRIEEKWQISDQWQQQPYQAEHCLALYQQYTRLKNGYALRDQAYYDHLGHWLEKSEQMVLQNETAYVLYEMIHQKCIVLESIYIDHDGLKALYNDLIDLYGSIIVLSEQNETLTDTCEEVLFLQARKNKKELPTGEIYFNEYI